MQTITTKYLGATNSRGALIKATCWNGTKTISYPYELSGKDVHQKAAQELIAMLESQSGIKWNIVADEELPDSTGYAFIIE